MAVSMRDLDSVFQGAGQKAGIELWRIENFRPVPVPQSSYGKFFTGDSYVILKTTALKSGAFRHDIHYWLGKDTSQDEAGTAAIKTVELDAALGGRAVQYREVQGRETEKFLSYFKPCIIPQEGGVASGFKHFNAEEHQNRLFVCRGKHVVHVKEVPFARSSLNHDDIFILDTKSKIFQFNGSNSSIQERAKALEVVQYIKDTYHDGKCEVAAIEDGKLMADAETGEFWGFFGGFAPLPRKAASENDKNVDSFSTRLLCIEKGQAMPVQAGSLTRELLDTNKCYLLDCGLEVFVWMGRNTSLDDRKSASSSAEELLREADRPRANIIRVIEGFETVMFRSKFDAWPQTTEVTVSEDGRGKVAALLKRQGFNVKGLLKVAPPKEEPQVYIDCTGNLQVWRINGQEKTSIPTSEQSKFYSGDCYIFQYSYPGEDKEEYLVGTWFGKQSGQEERAEAISLASNIIESLKSQPVQCAKQKEIATQPAKEEEERTREQKAKAFAKLEELNRRTFGDNVPSKSDGSKLLPKHDEVPIQEERIVKNAMVSEKLSVGMTQTSNSSIQSRLNVAEEDGGLVNHPAIEFTEVSGFLNHEMDAASTSSVSEYNVDDSSSQHKKKHTWNSKSKHKVNDASGESGLLASAPVEGNSIKPSVESGMVKCSETFVQDIRPVLVANTVEPEIVQRHRSIYRQSFGQTN